MIKAKLMVIQKISTFLKLLVKNKQTDYLTRVPYPGISDAEAMVTNTPKV